MVRDRGIKLGTKTRESGFTKNRNLKLILCFNDLTIKEILLIVVFNIKGEFNTAMLGI